jgi:hypothetical protein
MTNITFGHNLKHLEVPKRTLVVVDNFYNNPHETRNFVLSLDFEVRGNYPGQRTQSFATDAIKETIEGYIGEKITHWDNTGYNGSFQYTTSRDRSWIHTDHMNNWAGVLFLTPDAPVEGGLGLYKFHDGTRYSDEVEIKKIDKFVSESSQDVTKWKLVDRIGNVFNRLVLFNSKHFHSSMDYFGTDKNNGRLFQVFFFST